MADEIKITIFGDVAFRRRIRAVRYRARDMSPILEEIKDDWTNIIEEQFATEGSRTGRKWDRLALTTIIRRGSAHPILIENGDLLINTTDPDNISVSDDSIEMKLPLELLIRAESHQFGFDNARTGDPVPARPFVDFTDFDEERFRKKIGDYLVHGDGA